VEPPHQVDSGDFSAQHYSHRWGHGSAKIECLSKSVHGSKLGSVVYSPVPCICSVPSRVEPCEAWTEVIGACSDVARPAGGETCEAGAEFLLAEDGLGECQE
jgi:hypothetical protein